VEKFADGVVDTSGKFAKGFVDTDCAPSLLNISKIFEKFEMSLMLFLGALGKMTHRDNIPLILMHLQTIIYGRDQ
jgi:hypothetical protein